MNIAAFASQDGVFVTVECVHGHAFDQTRPRVKSALLRVICADFARSEDHYAHLQPMECLLPRHSRA